MQSDQLEFEKKILQDQQEKIQQQEERIKEWILKNSQS